MRLSVFRPSRREKGKRVFLRSYVGRYTLVKGGKPVQVGLDTPDKEIARKRLMAIVLEKQREQEGMIAPRTVRDTANARSEEHTSELQSH